MQIRKFVTLTIASLLLATVFTSGVSTSTAFSKQFQGDPLIARNVQVWKSTELTYPILVDISSDGKYVVAGSNEFNGVCLLNETGNMLWKFDVDDTPLDLPTLRWVCISDDGKSVAFGGDHWVDLEIKGFVFFFDRVGHIWNKTDFTGEIWKVWAGSISGNGSRVAVGYGNRVDVFDKAGVFKWGYDVADTVYSVSISFNGDYVAVGYDHGVCLLYEGDLVWERGFPYHYLDPVRISADSKYVIAIAEGLYETNVLYYNQTGTLLWTQTIDYSTYEYEVAISYNGEYAVAGGNTTIHFFDKTGLQWSYNTGEKELSSIDMSSDGNFIVASSYYGRKVLHLNKYGTLIWEISLPERAGHVAISGNGEYFATTDTFDDGIYLYFSKKYFNYRFVTPDDEPISNLDVKCFANGTLYTSMLTNATGWIEFFDPYFLNYSTEAYYWQTKVGSYVLVKTAQYESANTHVASLFDWDIYIHDAGGEPIQARVETYLWNDTLYDNRTTEHQRFENMPNQTYTLKVYYPGLPIGERVITLTQDEQTTTITLNVLDHHVKCVNYYNEPVPNVDVYLYFTNGTLHKQDVTNTTGFADFINILSDSYRVITQCEGVIVANVTDTVTTQDQTKVVELFLIGDAEPPEIHNPSHEPEEPLWTDTIKVSVNVTDYLSGVHDVILSYRINEELSWTNKTMTYHSTTLLYEANIPPQPIGTNMTYMITAHDNAGKPAFNDNAGQYFIYTVIPEFPSAVILLLIMALSTLTIIFTKKRLPKRRPNSKISTFFFYHFENFYKKQRNIRTRDLTCQRLQITSLRASLFSPYS